MARFRKTILTADKHQSPEGEVDATTDRIRAWANTHAAMRSVGVKTPVCWGHHLASVPHYDFDEQQLLGAKFNAGYFDELIASADGKSLDAILDVPGAEADANGNLVAWVRDPESGKEFKTAISEVSAAITKKLIDGQKREWNDFLSHIALVPYPVVGNQTGFQALGATAEGVTFLSLGSSGWKTLGTAPMAKEDPIDDEFDDDVVTDDKADAAGDDLDKDGDVDGADADMSQLIELLGRVCNVHIPEGETPQEFISQLKTVLQHMDTAANGGMPSADQATSGAAANSQNEPVTVESTPQMMSAARGVATMLQNNNALKRLIEKTCEGKRQRLQKRLDRARTLVPAHIIDGLALEPNTMMMSITQTGDDLDAVEPKLYSASEVLDLLTQAAKHQPGGKITQTLSTAHANANPLRDAIDKSGKVSDQPNDEVAYKLAGKSMPKPNGKKRREKV